MGCLPEVHSLVKTPQKYYKERKKQKLISRKRFTHSARPGFSMAAATVGPSRSRLTKLFKIRIVRRLLND